MILEAARGRPVTKTKLMQMLVLNYSRAARYTTELVEEGLLEYNLAARTFHTTQKGGAFLELSESLAGYLSPVDNLVRRYRMYLNEDESFAFKQNSISLQNDTQSNISLNSLEP